MTDTFARRGNATCDGGLVIDLSPMKAARVDAAARTVRARGGLTWGELDKVTQAFGLATTADWSVRRGSPGSPRRRDRVLGAAFAALAGTS